MQGPRNPVYLITDVLDEDVLSDSDVIEIYQARWCIEVYHRHLKQTFGRRAMLSQKSEHASLELSWSVIGFWAMLYYATREFETFGLELSRLSFAGVLHSFRDIARDYMHPADRRSTLRIQIRGSLLDEYDRKDKKARSHSRRKRKKPTGSPDIQTATKDERRAAKNLPVSIP